MFKEETVNPVFVRSVAEQTLDVLLRIEELLSQFVILLPTPVAPVASVEEPKEDRGNYEDRVTPETTKAAPKGRRNPRSL